MRTKNETQLMLEKVTKIRKVGSVEKETAIVDGGRVDSFEMFFICLGEAVSGPGGYFGWDLQSLHDCLHGGFGLRRDGHIVFQDSRKMKRMLGPKELIRYLENMEFSDVDVLREDEEKWVSETLKKANNGWSFYDEVVDLISGVAAISLTE